MNRSFPFQLRLFQAFKTCTAREFAAELGGAASERPAEESQPPAFRARALLPLARIGNFNNGNGKSDDGSEKVRLVRMHFSELPRESDLNKHGGRAAGSGKASR